MARTDFIFRPKPVDISNLDTSSNLNFFVSLLLWGAFWLVGTLRTVLEPIYRLLFGTRVPAVVRTPDERFCRLDENDYKYLPQYAELPIGGGVTLPRMHYLDEGNPEASEIILCLHGEPTWSFLYRKCVPTLTDAGYRVVAPDFIGFGRSDKYTHPDNYTLEMHTMSLRLLIEHLELTNITLVCQDWGGMIGLAVVKEMPDKFSSIVVMNTGLPNGDVMEELNAAPLQTLRNGAAFMIWRSFSYFVGDHLPMRFLFTKICGIHRDIAAMYSAPFPDRTYKAGVTKFPQMVPLARDDLIVPTMNAVRYFLAEWTKPVLIMFGDRDPITRGQDKMFKKLMPHAKEITVKGGPHFLQETHGEEIAANIVKFKKNKLD